MPFEPYLRFHSFRQVFVTKWPPIGEIGLRYVFIV